MGVGDRSLWVGPVLTASVLAKNIIEALSEENEQLEVEDRGSYYRVLAPMRCRVSKSSIEKYCGYDFHLPGDLERVMPAFKGRLAFTPDRVEWYFEETKEGDSNGKS